MILDVNERAVVGDEFRAFRDIRGGPFYAGRDGDIATTLHISREQVRDIRLGKKWKEAV